MHETRRAPPAALRLDHRTHRHRDFAAGGGSRGVPAGGFGRRNRGSGAGLPEPHAAEGGSSMTPVLILLIPFAFAGLALMNAGLVRSRNAAHSLMATLTVAAAAVLAYVVCGFAWQGFSGGQAYAVSVGAQTWNWIGAERFFLRGVDFEGTAGLAAGFGMFSAALAAMIPLGAGAERWRLGSAAASSALLAGWTYPLFAHWVWGGGWLAQLGFVDAGGTATIQVVGGLTALSVSWILGPRRGKYNHDLMPFAMPGHNAVFVLFGALLALL